jgi:dienelactone hydrolase
MTHALTSIVAGAGSPKVVFFGYSGGGALAMLIAERVEQTTAVVTIAANLDPDAWTAHHGFTSLHGSLKPVERAPLPPRITQVHYLGAKDSVVPPHLFADSMAGSPGTDVIVVENFTHTCCWVELWPEVLDHVDARLRRPQP